MVKALVYFIYIGVMTTVTVLEIRKQLKEYNPHS